MSEAYGELWFDIEHCVYVNGAVNYGLLVGTVCVGECYCELWFMSECHV